VRSVIRYRTKPEYADENQRLVESVYAELGSRDPGGIRYATLRLEDGVTFLHIFMTDSDEARNALSSSPAFAEFQKDLPSRCDEQPLAQSATIVGSYRLLSV
jgi:antibiotic biosynthesis monooxygenase